MNNCKLAKVLVAQYGVNPFYSLSKPNLENIQNAEASDADNLFSNLNIRSLTPLTLASIYGHLELIEYFATVIPSNNQLRHYAALEALFYAIEMGRIDVIIQIKQHFSK